MHVVPLSVWRRRWGPWLRTLLLTAVVLWVLLWVCRWFFPPPAVQEPAPYRPPRLAGGEGVPLLSAEIL